MTTKLQKLIGKSEDAAKELAVIDKQLTAARNAMQAEETKALVEDRELDPKLKRKLAELESAESEISRRVATIDRAIEEVRKTEEADKGQQEYQAREVLKKAAAKQLGRLRAATFELRNATLEVMELLNTPENFPLVVNHWGEFVFPASTPEDSEDIARRTMQLAMVNSATAWLRHDANYDRLGPQKP
ncbi:MAG: hypothetical protein JWN34_2848 [Bryobacterales bacterium]|nr:hypothetical protein [Bryobacterales bacterium]